MKRTVLTTLVVAAVLLGPAAAFAQSEGGGQTSGSGLQDDPALYAVGAVGASDLYTTYFLLGTLADGYATAAYTAAFADELVRDVIGLNESSIEVLERLVEEGGLVGDDRALVEEMIRAYSLLNRQAWGLISYIEDPADTDEWFEYRRAAWELITTLLDIG